jgi:hypothetical protein
MCVRNLMSNWGQKHSWGCLRTGCWGAL